MMLSNENIVHIKKEGQEYICFKRLLEYSDVVRHAYSVGIDKSYRTYTANREELPKEEYEKNMKNYKTLCEQNGLDYKKLVKTNANHTNNVIKVEDISKNPSIDTDEIADGLITNKKDLVLATTNADCILLLMFDPVKKVIANVHSGWKGTIKQISVKAVEKMINEYGCNPNNIIVCICPSIRKCHFEVDKDVYELFYNQFQKLGHVNNFIEKDQEKEKWHIDTVLINKLILKQVGILEENIVDSGICSVCNKELIHSFRAEGKRIWTCYCNYFIKIGGNMIPNRLKKGDTIAVIAPSNHAQKDDVIYLKKTEELFNHYGINIIYGKNIYSNSLGYGASPREKADDLNNAFKDKNVNAIFCAKGGENSNTLFDYIDYDVIKNNPKIFSGFSDSTFLLNMIYEKTGLTTFHSATFKSISDWDKECVFEDIIQKLMYGIKNLKRENEDMETIKKGKAEGILIGGNLNCISRMVTGKYSINFENKILFIEDLAEESNPKFVSSFLYLLKYNDVFSKINGLWIGEYKSDTGIRLEDIVSDVLGNEYNFPIIKSHNFGHIDTKITIPVGAKAKIDTEDDVKIKLLEDIVK